MQRANCREYAMYTNDGYVSPYLLWRLDSYEQVMREQAERTGGGNRPIITIGAAARSPNRKGTDDVEHRR